VAGNTVKHFFRRKMPPWQHGCGRPTASAPGTTPISDEIGYQEGFVLGAAQTVPGQEGVTTMSEPRIPLDVRLLIDARCDEFEAGWLERSPRPLEEFLDEVDPKVRGWLLEELLHLEIVYRQAAGETPDPETYAARFADEAAVVARVFAEATVFHEPGAHNQQMPQHWGSQSNNGSESQALSHTTVMSATRLRIVQEHARGGLGIVYLAHDETLCRDVALKEIQPEYVHQVESRQRFVREAEITGNLEHPSIVPIYGTGLDADGRPFYAMRFIKGKSLAEAIAEYHAGASPRGELAERALAFRKLLGRFLDICHAVSYAHSRGVLHRDIKPANILLGEYGETILVDWGLAKIFTREDSSDGPVRSSPDTPAGHWGIETIEGSRVGTPAYMSPEQAAGRIERLGPATDIYALGATLYTLLTNRRPVEGSSGHELLRQVQTGDWPRPRAVNRHVPRPLEAICVKAMALKPHNRYESVAALANDLDRWLANEPVSVWQEPWSERVLRWQRKYPGMALGGTVALLVLLVAVVGLSWLAASLNTARRQALTATRAAERSATEAKEAQNRTSQEAARREAESIRRLIDRGDWTSVLNALDSSVVVAHDDPVQLALWRIEAMHALSRKRELEQALASLTARADLGSHRGEVVLWQVDANWVFGRDSSAEHVTQAIELGLPPADEAYARSLIAKTIPEAIQCLHTALELRPFHYRAHVLLCAHLILSGQFDEGCRRAEAAQYLFPQDPQFPFLLALAATFERNPQEIDRHIQRLAAVTSPEYASRMRSVLDAIDDILSMAVDHGPAAVAQLATAAPALWLKWQQLLAATDGQEFNVRMPAQLARAGQKFVEALREWTFGKLFAGRKERAIAAMAEATEILPIDLLYTVHGFFLLEVGRQEEAVQVLERAVEAPTLFPEVRHLTHLYAARGYAGLIGTDPNSEVGKANVLKVVSHIMAGLETDDPPRYMFAACDQYLYVFESTRQRAHQLLERVHDKDPDDIEIASMLARSYLRQENYWRALQLAEEVLRKQPADQRALEVRQAAREFLQRWAATAAATDAAATAPH
jgi:tetratricopeptide (TPR) repeat protein